MENAPFKKEKWKKWTPSPLTLILLGLIAYLWFRPPADVSDDNRAAPPWQVTLSDGRVLSSESLKGRVVLVNFWATWCPYCRKEKPVIDDFWKDNRARGFEVIAISIDDTPKQIAAWANKTGYAFLAAPTNASVAAAFGAVGSVPTSFILDRDGHIRHKVAGQLHSARLKKLVEPLLASPAPLPLNPAVFLPSPANAGEGLPASDIPRRMQSPSPSDGTTNHSTDEAPSHSTRLSKNDNQVAGYKPASGQVAGYPHPSPAYGRGGYP